MRILENEFKVSHWHICFTYKSNISSFYEKLKLRGFVIYLGKIFDADTFRIGNIGDIFSKDMAVLIEAIREISGR